MRFHPRIYVPKKEIVVVGASKVGLKGYFIVERFRGDHRFGIKTGHWEFENLIVNGGLDLIGAGTELTLCMQWLAVGTGSTVPATGDTSLVAEVSPSTTHRTQGNGSIADVFASGASFTYWSLKRTRLFVEAQANGNLTELGFFTASTAGTMWTRQLFKDSGGTPTTIVKTSADQLRVTYELRIYTPADATASEVISGVSYTWLVRASKISSASNWGGTGSNGPLMTLGNVTHMGYADAIETDVLGTSSDGPAGTATTRSSTSLAAYTTGTFYRDSSYIWEPGIANYATGVGSIVFWAGSSGGLAQMFQESFTPKLPKDNTKRLTLVQRLTWGRR